MDRIILGMVCAVIIGSMVGIYFDEMYVVPGSLGIIFFIVYRLTLINSVKRKLEKDMATMKNDLLKEFVLLRTVVEKVSKTKGMENFKTLMDQLKIGKQQINSKK